MTKLKLNREYASRHLFVTLLMLALGGWFGYDGFIGYPKTPAIELYRTIEKADPPAGFDLEKFKAQKTKTQYGFTILAFAAALIVGSGLYSAWRFDFEFDEREFVHAGRRFPIDGIKRIDRSKWAKKGIVKVDGITLDAWHHTGVKDFEKILPDLG